MEWETAILLSESLEWGTDKTSEGRQANREGDGRECLDICSTPEKEEELYPE